METNTTFTIEVSKLDNNPFQPRKQLSPADVVDLANSIREVGLMQPICVRQVGDRWQIISGHRRVAAYHLLAKGAADEEARKMYSSIRAEVRNDVSDAESLRMCLTENLQRDNLHPLEVAEGLSKLQHLDERFSNPRVLGEAVGLSHTYARQLLQLASAPPYIKGLLDHGAANNDQDVGGDEQPSWKLSPTAVLELVRGHESLASIPGLSNPEAFAKRRVSAVMHRAIARQWSARAVRKAVDMLTADRTPKKKVAMAATTAATDPKLKLNAKTRTEVSAPQSSPVAIPPQSGGAPLPVPEKKSASESLEVAWEVLVLGVVVSVAGGFLQPAIVSTVVTWVGTAISLSGMAMLVRTWAPLQNVWTKTFQVGVAWLWREIRRTHSEAQQPGRVIQSEAKGSSKPSSPREKRAA